MKKEQQHEENYTTRVLNLMDYFKCYKVIARTIISKKNDEK